MNQLFLLTHMGLCQRIFDQSYCIPETVEYFEKEVAIEWSHVDCTDKFRSELGIDSYRCDSI